MTAPRAVATVLEALEARRARLSRLAEQLADELDKQPSPALHQRLRTIARSINEPDQLIDARRRGR